ncbi:hypothetical protein DPMN_051505 [Dreissena polymorpha]|uniref:Uncharacterized protein n=1 Tax=Dreissena polymorpha TaxID=45954 RepID=A0A9D4CJ41_DREPO|nr:hypothetical protein DPMN_051505 [Dreissena polymorpha]
MGLTQGKYDAERVGNQSSTSIGIWSPSNKGPYRYIRIKANPQNDTLKLCEVQVKGYTQAGTPCKNILNDNAI